MAAPRTKKSNDSVQFWLPDPADLERLLEMLEIFGYTDESFAREEASLEGENTSLIEVTVRRREMIAPQPWREEIAWNDNSQDVVWHA